MAPLDSITKATTPDQVRDGALALRDVYERRASRQQRITDVLASVSFLGAIGVYPASRVGDGTQRAWLVGAFIPVLISNHNAFEPTRDLYFAGALAMEMITQRYGIITSTRELLNTGNVVGAVSPPDCTAIPVGGANDPLAREAAQLRGACLDLKYSNDALKAYELSLEAQYNSALIATPFKTDVLALDTVLLDRDRDFRTTPLEAITNVVALAPRTAEFVLSGTNVQQLINDVKVQTALNGMDLELHRPFLPTLPPAVDDLDLPDDTAVTVERHQTLGPIVHSYRASLDRYRQRRSLIVALDQALKATELSFTYDATNRMVRVQLAAPTPAPAPLATAMASQ